MSIDSTYCPDCKVKVMEETCFCDWPESLDVALEREKVRLLLDNQETKSDEFKDKIKSITFNRVKGGGRE
jgi:hypothetical protein